MGHDLDAIRILRRQKRHVAQSGIERSEKRLCHRVEIVQIEGASYQATEAQQRAKSRGARRRTKP